MELTSSIDIAAPVARVWDLTVDVERWPTLTPTITEVVRLDDRPFDVGSAARIRQPRQRPRTWTVTRMEAGRTFEWTTRVGVVTMVGGHRLEATPEGCRNVLSLRLDGWGSGLLGLVARRQLQAAIDTENAGFRRAAEAAGAVVSAAGDPAQR